MSLGSRRQYVYRCKPDQLQQMHCTHQLVVLDSAAKALPLLPGLLQAFGFKGALQRVARLLKGERASLYFRRGSRIVAECQLTFGHCSLYPIGDRDAVLGPVWTDPDQRGQGLATQLLSESGKVARARDCREVWIDTSEANGAMRRSIEKAGFPAEIFVMLGDW